MGSITERLKVHVCMCMHKVQISETDGHDGQSQAQAAGGWSVSQPTRPILQIIVTLTSASFCTSRNAHLVVLAPVPVLLPSCHAVSVVGQLALRHGAVVDVAGSCVIAAHPAPELAIASDSSSANGGREA